MGQTIVVRVELVRVGLVSGCVLFAFAGDVEVEDDGVDVGWGLTYTYKGKIS